VALTAHALPLPGDKARCIAAGMDGYLSKPFRPSDLMRAIAAVLYGHSLSGAAETSSPAPVIADEINELLVVEYESKLKEIGVAVAAGRLGDVRTLVHRLKGAMSLFHTGDPYAAADRLEMTSAAADRRGTTEAWPVLERHLERLLAELHNA
jgi:DNA-binding response OmpR family regulator